MTADANSLLREAEISVERSISFVRCGVGISISIFFFGIVGTTLSPGDPLINIFPYVAAFSIGYFVVGLATFYFARPDRFRRWMIWLFTTCDLCFWYALLVAAVFNLELPGNYIVALPAIFIVFVILALVALRNNPWLLGYALMFIVVALFILFMLTPEPTLESEWKVGAAFVLFQLPANIARLSMIVLAGLVLIYVAVRTRRLLNRAIVETVRRANISRYLPPQLARRLAQIDQDRLLSGTSQEAAVLFVDIRSFTTLAENMEPEALSRFLAEYRRIVTARVHANNGIVDKFVGDSVMAVFGAPDISGNDAANALECASDLVEHIANWNVERRREELDDVLVGVGAHWGEVFCGAIGDMTRLEFTVLGDTVNVAARLEQLTKEVGFSIVVSQALLTKAGLLKAEESGWVSLGDSHIRGRSGHLQIFARR